MTETIPRARGKGGLDCCSAQAAADNIVRLRGKDGWKPAAPPLVMDMGESGAVSQTIVKEE